MDLYPPQWFDERAYLEAARMRLGLEEPGPLVSMGSEPIYRYERIRPQAVPLALQAAFARVLAPSVVSLRLASIAAMGMALLVGALALRRDLSPRAAAWTLALAATAPLCLAYARNGQYMAVSSLHGALVFAALLALHRRWSPGAAALAGALLGASLYFYQVSWFAPVLAALAFAADPSLWRRPRAGRIVAATCASALLVAAPGFVALRDDLRQVAGQTFFKGWWLRAEKPEAPAWAAAFVVVPADRAPEAEAFLSSVASPDLRATSRRGGGGATVLQLLGGTEELARATAAARERSFRVLDYGRSGDSAWARARGMLQTLLQRPGWEANGRWIEAPLLDPLLVPLLLLGAVEAWRRRRLPAARLLLVWVAGALLLPAVFGGPAPRRAVLALPFLYAFPGLALVALAGDARAPALRRATPALAALFLAAVVAVNLWLHEERWHRDYAADADASVLALSQRLHRLPRSERILVSRRVERLGLRVDDLDAERPGGADQPGRVLLLSCSQRVPFTWVLLDAQPEGGAFDVLDRAFVTRAEPFGAFRLVRVVERRPGACTPRERGAR